MILTRKRRRKLAELLCNSMNECFATSKLPSNGPGTQPCPRLWWSTFSSLRSYMCCPLRLLQSIYFIPFLKKTVRCQSGTIWRCIGTLSIYFAERSGHGKFPSLLAQTRNMIESSKGSNNISFPYISPLLLVLLVRTPETRQQHSICLRVRKICSWADLDRYDTWLVCQNRLCTHASIVFWTVVTLA